MLDEQGDSQIQLDALDRTQPWHLTQMPVVTRCFRYWRVGLSGREVGFADLLAGLCPVGHLDGLEQVLGRDTPLRARRRRLLVRLPPLPLPLDRPGHTRRPRLLGRDPDEHEWPHVFTEFAVCDPLHRRHVLLPALPEDLAASVDHPVPRERWPWCEHFLFPLDEESQSPATAFRVICVALCEARFAAFVFSSCTRQWRATASSKGWSDLFHGSADSDRMTPMSLKFQRHHYANGCFYWDSTMISRKRLLVLDTRRMEFSIVDLPPGVWSTQGIGVVEAGEGRLGMFVFGAKIGPGLRYFIARNEGESPSEWHMQKTISLDSGYRYAILDATGSYLLLQRIKSSSQDMPLFEYFSIDTKTLQLQRVCAKQRMPTMFGTHTYTNFPPSLLLSPRAMLSGSMES